MDKQIKTKNYPSIFNDVIGPVMRGPSSSHCAASLRIGRLCRDLMQSNPKKITVRFDPNGSLATTHRTQGSDMGLFGGFLGWEIDDERLPGAETGISEAKIEVEISIEDIGADHPNTYDITLDNEGDRHHVIAISIGGGMFEITEVDGASLSICGDYWETLIYVSDPAPVRAFLEPYQNESLEVCKGQSVFLLIKTAKPLEAHVISALEQLKAVQSVRQLHPVLPILSRREITVPFITCEEMINFNKSAHLELWELALRYESERGQISEDSVFERMRDIVKIMQKGIDKGLQGTEYEDRILGSQSPNFVKQMKAEKLPGGGTLNNIIAYVSALMEVKSSMGVIVAAPTAGSCGALPGAVFGMASSLNLGEDEIVKAMLAAGMIGVFIAAHASFAAEVGGCMAECGSGSGMAAAALVFLADGTLSQSISAASVALQNSLGLVCDPVANRVEAPCLGKNVHAATGALSCANMALADYDHLIPLDEVIDTMDKVGQTIPNTLRCTGLGGLSITKSSKEIEQRVNGPFFKSC